MGAELKMLDKLTLAMLVAATATLPALPARATPTVPGNAIPLTIRPTPDSGIRQFGPQTRAKNTCSITAPNMNFGTYDIFSSTPLTSTMSFTVSCGNGYQGGYVYINFGTGSSGTYNNRTMSNGTDTLNYNIYADTAHTTIVGDCSGVTTCYYGYFPKHGGSGSATVYGLLPAQQNVSPGTYNDVVTITLYF